MAEIIKPAEKRVAPPMATGRKSGKKMVTFLVLLVLILAGTTAYFGLQLKKTQEDPQVKAQAEIASLVERVSQLIVLPEGETPTIATVNDPEKLKDQAFFAKAKEGYKVLIYAQAKKAILYDPIAHKIVEVAPLNIGASTPTTPTTTNTEPTTPVENN